jgi:hypothetical protein
MENRIRDRGNGRNERGWTETAKEGKPGPKVRCGLQIYEIAMIRSIISHLERGIIA